MQDKEYLGDALYVVDHKYQLELRANDLNYPTDRVYLEDEVMERLIKFWKSREIRMTQEDKVNQL